MCEDANSKLVYVVTVADVFAEKRIDDSLVGECVRSIFTHETKMFISICLKCSAVLYSDWSFQMDQMGPKMTLGTLTMSGDDFPGV